MRADAQRSYDRVLAAAKHVFAERGVDAPLDVVAKRAGVGNATLYRHFPSRPELIVAVYADEVAELCGYGNGLLGREDVDDALDDWLAAFVRHVATKRDLALAVPQSGRFEEWHTAMRATTAALVERASSTAGANDLVSLAHGCALAGGSVDRALHLLWIARDGYRRRPV